jgi:hypothetical protein
LRGAEASVDALRFDDDDWMAGKDDFARLWFGALHIESSARGSVSRADPDIPECINVWTGNSSPE